MKIRDLVTNSEIELINEGLIDNEINHIFASDLMSHVMGFAEESDILITVLNNINVLGVASLLDFSGVIFTHNVNINESIIKKAIELEIPILKTKLSTADTIILLNKMGV